MANDYAGPQGIQGSTGHKGDRGAQGEQGIQGIQGTEGNTDNLSFRVGEVVGQMKIIATEVASMRGELTGVHTQLAAGTGRMGEISVQLGQMCELQKIANGRTNKLEKAVAVLERRWQAVTFLPRLFDRLAKHKVFGLVLATVASGVAGAALQRFL